MKIKTLPEIRNPVLSHSGELLHLYSTLPDAPRQGEGEKTVNSMTILKTPADFTQASCTVFPPVTLRAGPFSGSDAGPETGFYPAGTHDPLSHGEIYLY